MQPSYISCISRKELNNRTLRALQIMESCTLCPRMCRVNRFEEEQGVCKAPSDVMVSSASPHFGEEPPLVGRFGSGTIFLTHCNLRCVFCQNYDISHMGQGNRHTSMKFGDIMIGLQNMGCHNINLVTPTHYVPKILEGLLHAIDNGLNIPIVYNCSGYENVEILELLDGIVDIYMPDIKFMESAPASEYMDASDYPDRVRNAVVVMHKQVGDLECDKNGIAVKGLLIRHLVMPNHGSNTEKVLEFIANEISLNSYVNIMDQYHSMYRAHEYKNLTRRATREEYIHACKFAESLGLYRGFGKRLHE